MNKYEESLREAKANALADAIVNEYRAMMGYDINGNEIDLKHVLEAILANEDTEDWDFFADMIEVPTPSQKTIDLVYALIRCKMTFKVPADPFDGILGR